MMSTTENRPVSRDSYISSVLEDPKQLRRGQLSSCIAHTLRFCTRCFLALTKNRSIFSGTLKYLITLLFSFPVQAVDIENGKTLHNENCMRCHTPSQYTRENRIVNSFDELRTRISQCELMAELTWFDEEIDDVSAYINEAFYHFNLEK